MNNALSLEILQRANTGLMVVSADNSIIFCNRWLQTRCDWAHKSVEGVEITTLFPRFKEPRIARALADALQFGISSTLSHSIHKNIFPLSKKSGDPIHHAVLIQSIHADHQTYALIEVTDVTSSIKREHSMRKAQQEAEEASRAKEEFLASMSHELRTPLTTIIGNSELLGQEEKDLFKKELIHTIEIAGRGQLALVNDVLDMSKIESGKFTIDAFPFNLSTLVHDLEHLFTARACELGLDIVIQQNHDEKQLILSDGQRIQQILINLIGNALKFTEDGSVTLTVSTDKNELVFAIQDTGIGMDDKTLERLFQRFEQADNSISRRFGGSGLGLYISENLAALMGGKIEVSSQPGVGSTFTLRLPFQRSDISIEQNPNHRSQQSSMATYLNGEVLVVEDTLEIQLLVKRILENMGVIVTTAKNGLEGVELASSHPFDLILMDMQMPEMDGIEATQTLRDAGNATPIVALTANVMQKHRDAFQTAGCNDFLSKPIDKFDLQQTLKQYLKEGEQEPSETLEQVTDDELVKLFESTCSERREALINATAQKNWALARETAHTIKGSCTNFGHPELMQLSKEVCNAVDHDQLNQIESHVIALIAAMKNI